VSSRHHLAQVIGQRSLKSTNFNKLAKEIAAYLLETGKLSELDSLMRDIMNYRAEHGVIEVMATSANELSRQDIADIKSLLPKNLRSIKLMIPKLWVVLSLICQESNLT
jgi:F0F1-type ATP synthase delta subunit